MFLVDAHLLDTLVGAIALGVAEAALVHCRGQRPATELIARSLEGRGISTRRIDVGDEFRLADLDEVLAQLGDGWHLHHTGGPHGLAVLIQRAAVQRGTRAADASMLDVERRRLRFDDGEEVLLAGLLPDSAVTVADVVSLAGVAPNADPNVRPRPEVVLAAAEWATARQGRNRRELSRLAVSEIDDAWVTANLPAAVADTILHAPPEQRGWWRHWLIGPWLEDLTVLAIQSAAQRLGLPAEAEAGVAVHPPEGPGFEVDTLAVVGHRPHVVSCTCREDEDGVRAKAYEAERRAWQLAGPIARPAVVAPVTHLAATVKAHFLEPLELHRSSELEFFGRDDIRDWITALGTGAPLDRVESWLARGLGL